MRASLDAGADGLTMVVRGVEDLEPIELAGYYVVAEALAEFDELFQKFRQEHMQLIHRTIGFAAKSLKGRPVEILEEGMRQKFFPELWEIRTRMTDKWGAEYGVKRDSLGGHH